MTSAVMNYILNIWKLWSESDVPMWMWFNAFRRIVQQACRWTQQGWTDEQIIQCIRDTETDIKRGHLATE